MQIEYYEQCRCQEARICPKVRFAFLVQWPESGGSHKSIKCMPCCKRYIGNAFSSFHTLTGQIAPRHDLAEMSGSSELCKGLADSIEVPTLSEQHRQLVREVTAVLRRQTPMRLTYS
uniref:Uncharacterized protein n=1 Tax=Setaria viridis TaxID=4556 RepID=A0A4U6WH17_SETVI|nr:hypothetical protein SEVIR_1G322600v2 [Setaria viridis]